MGSQTEESTMSCFHDDVTHWLQKPFIILNNNINEAKYNILSSVFPVS